MIKYNRKQINKDAQLHDEEFVTSSDAKGALMLLVESAVKAGADKDKLMKFYKGYDGE